MTIEEIIKAAKEKELDSGIIDAIKALDQTADVERLKGELESEQGKAKGILEDKKKFKERAEKAEADLKKIEHDKLPEDEKRTKELNELKEQLESEKAEREKQAQQFAQTQREAKLSDLTGQIKWADGVPHDTAKLIIKTAMTEIEDLSDKSKIEETLKAVKESHKSFIAADAPGGTGGKSGGEQGTGEQKEYSLASATAEAWANTK